MSTDVRFTILSATYFHLFHAEAHAKCVLAYLDYLRLYYLKTLSISVQKPILFNMPESIISAADTNQTLMAFQSLGHHVFLQSTVTKQWCKEVSVIIDISYLMFVVVVDFFFSFVYHIVEINLVTNQQH